MRIRRCSILKGSSAKSSNYKHKVIQIPDEGKLIVQVYFYFKNLAGKPKCFLDCSQMQLFQHGMSKDFYPGSTDTESLNAGIVILPGYSLDVAKGFEIQDYSDVLLRYVPWVKTLIWSLHRPCTWRKVKSPTG